MNIRRKLPYVCEWYCNHFLVGFDPFKNLNKIPCCIQYMIREKKLINEREKEKEHISCA
jgi:hypothetical protein